MAKLNKSIQICVTIGIMDEDKVFNPNSAAQGASQLLIDIPLTADENRISNVNFDALIERFPDLVDEVNARYAVKNKLVNFDH